YKIAIASNSFKEIIKQTLNYLGFEMQIELLMTGEDMRPKPNPDILLKIAEILDVPTEECLVLEDSRVGIEAANRANMKVGYIPD
ncbi:HAD-IA family hydrolase, partial [Erysipelatoclostridium ramosum]